MPAKDKTIERANNMTMELEGLMEDIKSLKRIDTQWAKGVGVITANMLDSANLTKSSHMLVLTDLIKILRLCCHVHNEPLAKMLSSIVFIAVTDQDMFEMFLDKIRDATVALAQARKTEKQGEAK